MSARDTVLENRFVKSIRQRLTLRLLRRLHRVTHRMTPELRTVEPGRVLVVAPHMDDEVIGPGGTLAMHRRAGSDIDVAFCAAGGTPGVDETRRAEASECAELMGFSELIHLGFPEGSLSLHEPDMARELAAIVRRVRPDSVFVPFVGDNHRDHSACALATSEALISTGFDGDVWAYEVWSPLRGNVFVDISDVEQTKRAAIACYESQTDGVHYVDGALGLNRYRGLRVYVDHAEAFFVTSAKEFARIGRAMNTF